MLNPDIEGSDDTQGKEDDAARNQARTWESFSNHAAGKSNSVISLESWHDGIHDLVNGQMGNSAVAGVCCSTPFFRMQLTKFVGSLILSSGFITGKFFGGKSMAESLTIVLVISIACSLCSKRYIPISMSPRTVK